MKWWFLLSLVFLAVCVYFYKHAEEPINYECKIISHVKPNKLIVVVNDYDKIISRVVADSIYKNKDEENIVLPLSKSIDIEHSVDQSVLLTYLFAALFALSVLIGMNYNINYGRKQ